MSSDIDVDIAGTADTRFSARWELTRADGSRQVIEEEGRIPTRRHFQGMALTAELTVLDEGRLQLAIQKGNSRSRSSTGGAGSRISISVQ
ncbi:hypothetical protein GCM10010082_11130 [Kushneria pakistanensis]|uniref:Uncharacterized protein n=1 Tax=Kushneria pakistanensis TaxID=1508770 RepID=A0ABQ3FET4_9GAMM|nr:hypothetical protein [Kushneria pakistanensis]GHC21246.1 hypothetical protein GCM10010082_11130 [Kushneria pakistanensis]